MRKTAVFAIVMVLALSLLATGCIQKSEHEKIVAEMQGRIDAATASVTKLTADLAAATATIEAQKPLVAAAEKFSKEVTVWTVTDKLASSKVRVAAAAKVEGVIEGAVAEALLGAGMPKDAKFVALRLKADTATITLSKEFKTNFPKDAAAQKLVISAIVNTATEFAEVKKVVVTTTYGAVKLGTSYLYKGLVRDDAALK